MDCACVVALPVAAVSEGGDDQTWSVAQVLITIRQTSIDHLGLEVVLLHRVGGRVQMAISEYVL